VPDGEPAKGSDRNRTIIIVAAITAVAALGITAIVTLGGHSTATSATSITTRPKTVVTSTTVAPSTTAAPATSAPPVLSLPTLTIASWTGREPVTLYFSGDAGNVATSITWSIWDQTEAVGHGVRQELSCVPNCAQGTATPYPVTVTLNMPVDGAFTSIQEQTADGKGTAETFSPPEVPGVCPNTNQDSCVFVES
jgi:hypothetical protein